MKKISWLLILLFLPVIVNGFFDKRLPTPLPEVYPVKLRNLTFFDLVSKDLDMLRWNQAELTESKPDGLEVDPGELNLADVKYGCFKFGNLERKTWFIMGQDSDGYWSEFYIDQNLDQRIEKKEKAKGFQTGQDSIQGLQRMQALSLVPVQVKVAYKGITAEFEKSLYFFIRTGVYQKNNLSDTIVMATTASFMEGEFKVSGSGSRLVKFRIIDTNGNGCFNDYGTDLLSMDLNHDGYFRKNETSKLAEYPVSSDKKQRWRLVVPPFPAKIAVVDVIAEIDPATLEPSIAKENIKSETTAEAVPTATPEPNSETMKSSSKTSPKTSPEPVR
jgi:hypothetical protein